MRRKITDHSGEPKNNLPPTPKPDLLIFHWSPTTNRNSIKRRGLDIHRKTLQGDWRPPYVCFSDDPWLAWVLSGRMWPEIKSWDLWMCNLNIQDSFQGYELILDTFPDTGRRYTKEYRIYSRVFKRDLTYIGTREQED